MVSKLLKTNLLSLQEELERAVISIPKLDKILASGKVKLNAFVDESSMLTLLHIMIRKNKVLSAKWLLQNHANPYVEDKSGTPAFFYFADVTSANQFFDLFVSSNIDLGHKSAFGRMVLQDIALGGNVELFKKVAPKVRNIFSLDNYTKNVLFDAVASGNRKMMDYVFGLPNAPLDIQTSDQQSLLHYFKDAPLDTIEYLLEKKVPPHLQDDSDKNIIFYLSQRLESSLQASDLQRLSDIIDTAIEFKELREQKDNQGNNLLTNFLKNMHKKLNDYNQKDILSTMIMKFVDKGVSVDEKDLQGNNPLLIAASKNDLDTVKILLSKEANINVQNKDGLTPLAVAILHGDSEYLELVKFLMDYGADANVKDNKGLTVIEKMIYILIFIANQERNKKNQKIINTVDISSDAIMKLNENNFIKNAFEAVISCKFVDLNQLDSGNNPYFFAFILSLDDYFSRMMLRYGSDINMQNHEGKNILEYYLEHSYKNKIDVAEITQTMKYIIRLGIDLNSKDANGATILHKIALKYPTNFIKILCTFNPSLDAIDNRGRTVLHNAIWSNNLETVKFILNNNKKLLNQLDFFGILPINYAAFMGNVEIILYLIGEGSQINNPNEKPKHILDFFKKFHKNIIKIENTKMLSPSDRKNLGILLEHMKAEFIIID